ncbi:hypothetical protein LJR220_002633 [Bradyrhizobium sp. LjRoot220]|uniref:hypothetical protein n=1 Tax=Bradyrhizobium sp. LjRoot220 TaxID=3342284 RepID=UPI003ECE3A5A
MSRRFGVGLLVACVTAVVAPAVLVLVVTGYFHRDMIDSIYKNVDDISDATEMPTTVTSFQSSPEVVSTLGGSGEGLNCSLPGLANMFFDDIKSEGGQRALVLQRFRQACVFHDLCYRHGLATYGYNQNDCDRILQNAALRLCYVWNPIDKKARCQTESKMVLAGVSLGGADAYRAWDRSTYFEFEPDPSRSSRFLVSRVVDHPFKAVDRDKYKDDPDQVILTFDNVRSNLTVTCVTCKDAPVLTPTSDRYDLSAELRSVGLKRIPEGLLKAGSPDLSATNAVWLPPRRRHAAPHLLVDSAGKNHLIWMTRNNPGDTVSCIVLADAAKLLTHTLPERDRCSEEAGSRLSMVEVDMHATSPLPMEIPARSSKDNVFATAISVKSKRNLGFCSRSASRTIDEKAGNDDKAECIELNDVKVFDGAGLGAFQNFAIVRPGQLVLFARNVAVAATPASAWTRFSQNIWGVKYSPSGAMLVIDVAAPSSEKGPLMPKIRKTVRFNIEDRFDPMMPITRRRDDLRFLSLETTDKEVGVRVIDFAKEDPAVGDVRLEMNGSKASLHRSWASRPVLVLETREAHPKTKLVFSRGAIAANPHASVDNDSDIVEPPNRPFNRTKPQTESLALETLIFERDAAPSSSGKPFVKTSAASCMVKYTFRRHEEFPCYRKFDAQRPMRASPAARMQASQLLVGRFAGRDGYGIAFPEFCASGPPIILRQNGDGSLGPEESSTGDAGTFTREVTCRPLDSNEYVSGPIKSAPDMTISAADWPYEP